jgi:RNA polymerase sigma-70 factor (ECF subfamily)
VNISWRFHHKVGPDREQRFVNTSCGSYQQTHLAAAQTNGTSPAEQHGSQDVQELQTFYEENLGLIYRYIYSRVGNREEAEDLTSQTFVKAVRGIDRERSRQSMQKWLFQIARTTVADYWRAYYRISVNSLDELLDAGWEGPTEEEPLPISTAPNERVQRILLALPEHYREILNCRFLLNLSIKDTAQRMGLTEANVKVLQFRALKRAADIEETLVETTGS